MEKLLNFKKQAPYLEKLNFLDVEDRKLVKSYNANRKRKIRSLKKVKITEL